MVSLSNIQLEHFILAGLAIGAIIILDRTSSGLNIRSLLQPNIRGSSFFRSGSSARTGRSSV
jgi:hypothetical protein